MSVTVQELYDAYEVLSNAKDKAKDHLLEYMKILSGVRGESQVKRLSASFIPKFYKHFPDVWDTAMDAIMDLCEETDAAVRREAIKSLPEMCKEGPEQTVKKIADILTQLLQTDDVTERRLVNRSLCTLFDYNVAGAMGGLFNQLQVPDADGEEDVVVQRALEFVKKDLCQDILPRLSKTDTKAEDCFVAEVKKVLESPDVGGEEFNTFVNILLGLKSFSRKDKRDELLEIIAAQLGSDDFNPADADSWPRIIDLMGLSRKICKGNADGVKIASFALTKVIPVYTSAPQDTQYALLQASAEAVSAAQTPIPGSDKAMEAVFKALMECLPKPAEGDEAPSMELAYLECLLFILHRLGKENPDFFNNEDQKSLSADTRIRLQYCGQHTQSTENNVKQSLGKKIDDQEKKKQLQLALKMCESIRTIIKDLFHKPPQFKSKVVLSWTSPTPPQQPQSKGNQARAAPAQKPKPTAATANRQAAKPAAAPAKPESSKAPQKRPAPPAAEETKAKRASTTAAPGLPGGRLFASIMKGVQAQEAPPKPTQKEVDGPEPVYTNSRPPTERKSVGTQWVSRGKQTDAPARTGGKTKLKRGNVQGRLG